MIKRIILLWYAVLLCVVSASAQFYRNLDTQAGLSSRRVLSIEKDQRGYMWFLTHEGIDRYNGMQFIHYKLTDEGRDIQQFPNLSSLHCDSRGDLWVFVKDGHVFKYNPIQDRYEQEIDFTGNQKDNNRLPLTATYIDREDRIWLCTHNEQYLYYPQTKKLIRLESPIHEEITCITQGEDNRFYLGSLHNIYSVKLDGERLSLKPDSLLENFHVVNHLHFHPSTQTLIIGTLMDGIYLYNRQAHKLEEIGRMKDVNINAITPYPQTPDTLLIATNGNGVFLLDMAHKELQPFHPEGHNLANKTNGNIIRDIYIDEESRVWMAVFPIGVSLYSDKYPGYEWMQHEKGNPNSLVSNEVNYILEDSDGDLWFATSNGICLYNTHTKKWRSILSSYQQDKENQNHVFVSLCEASPGVILVGGYMSGMYRIDKRNMTAQYISPQNENWKSIRPDKYIRSIYRDKEGYIWAGGYYNLKCIDLRNGQVEHFPMEYPITCITQRNEDKLWIGTINGLYTFDKRKKELQYMSQLGDMGSINTIFQPNEKDTYIGTHGTGLWIYNNTNQHIENFRTDNSALINNNIYCILPSNQPGEYIISTENELVCFNVLEKVFVNWTNEQGLPLAKFNAAGVHTTDGNIVFGSGNGVILINETVCLPRSFNSRMVFDNFAIQYQKMTPGSKDSPLTKGINETDKITLRYNQNIFSLDVSSINYDCPSRIFYSWMLEGFFDTWTRPGPNHLIRYTNLDPGTYILRVRTVLQDDGSILQERAIRIHITPPFSQTLWAYLIYAFLGLLVVAAIMRFLWMRKVGNISREKIQFFIRTAHDIRTPLTLIKAPLSEISRNEKLTEQGQQNLQMAIQSTDKLTELATKLIEFQKEELYTSDVNVTLCELNNYMRDFLLQFAPYAERKHIRMIFTGTEDNLEAWIDRNKVDSIVHNLVSNALKYTPDGGEVQVRLGHNRTHWFMKITDTGIGISEADQKKMFKHLFRGNNAVNLQITGTGIGMLHTHRLVTRHYGKISVRSKEGEGTIFRLRFPIDDPRYIKNEITKAKNKEEAPHDSPSPSQANEGILPATSNNTSSLKEILIVEDNTDLRNFLRQSLSESYRIEEASNGQEALDRIATRQPDLVLSDVLMPVMRGDDLCRVLKNNIETSHIPVILLTALNDRESIIHGLETKADNYIVKPFDIDILKASIAGVLANKELVRQRFAQMDYHTEDIQSEVPGVDLDKEFITKATAIIKKNLDNDFNVDALCASLNMSRTSFYTKIKSLTGKSPSDFVRQIRLNEAAMMLKSRRYTVAEVSDMLGYGDPKYFTDIFKKYYGVPPSVYMKQE